MGDPEALDVHLSLIERDVLTTERCKKPIVGAKGSACSSLDAAAVVTRDVSALLKGARPKPVLVRLAFRTAFPLPQAWIVAAEFFQERYDLGGFLLAQGGEFQPYLVPTRSHLVVVARVHEITAARQSNRFIPMLYR
jgi:hypothetical protein